MSSFMSSNVYLSLFYKKSGLERVVYHLKCISVYFISVGNFPPSFDQSYVFGIKLDASWNLCAEVYCVMVYLSLVNKTLELIMLRFEIREPNYPFSFLPSYDL